jgi:hypothetical protein
MGERSQFKALIFIIYSEFLKLNTKRSPHNNLIQKFAMAAGGVA